MSKTRKEELAEAGFEETTIQKFLDLSDIDMKLIDLKIELGKLLKKQRKVKKLTQSQLADIVKTNQARIARIENADNSVSIDSILISLYSVGTKEKDISGVFAKV